MIGSQIDGESHYRDRTNTDNPHKVVGLNQTSGFLSECGNGRSKNRHRHRQQTWAKKWGAAVPPRKGGIKERKRNGQFRSRKIAEPSYRGIARCKNVAWTTMVSASLHV